MNWVNGRGGVVDYVDFVKNGNGATSLLMWDVIKGRDAIWPTKQKCIKGTERLQSTQIKKYAFPKSI